MPLQIPSSPSTGDAAWQTWASALRGELERFGREIASSNFNAMAATGTTILPAGFSGPLFINNTSAAPATITLPPSVPAISIDAKDIAGNAGTYNITFNCSGGSLIDGAATYVFVNNFQAATFRWNGTGWSVF